MFDPIGWIKWILSLARPENLRTIVNLGGSDWVSYSILAAIIFSETGLLIGFFLPGDSLLFSAGFLASKQPDQEPIFDFVLLNVVLSAAAILGDAVNYSLGWQLGEKVLERGRLRWIKHDHLVAAQKFYERHGGMAIILARFAPFVRTFTPFVAGIARMKYTQFVLYNILGGIGWVLSMTTAGYMLGQIGWIQRNFELVVLGIVVVSVMPVFFSALKSMRAKRAAQQQTP